MKTDRLFEILFLLLQKRKVSAQELADRFEVSVRTIYRDIHTLSAAHIPIYTVQGTGGGIALMDEYVLARTFLSTQEKEQLMDALQCLRLLQKQEDTLLVKLSALFQMPVQAWLQMDLNGWSDNRHQKEFSLLQTAILQRRCLHFTYLNVQGEVTHRHIEPQILVFKQQSWYCKGYDLDRCEVRIFKITRMRELVIEQTQFLPRAYPPEKAYPLGKRIFCRVRIQPQKLYRAYDELELQNVTAEENGVVCADVEVPEKWLISYFMSYGDGIEIITPASIREQMKMAFQKVLSYYS